MIELQLNHLEIVEEYILMVKARDSLVPSNSWEIRGYLIISWAAVWFKSPIQESQIRPLSSSHSYLLDLAHVFLHAWGYRSSSTVYQSTINIDESSSNPSLPNRHKPIDITSKSN